VVLLLVFPDFLSGSDTVLALHMDVCNDPIDLLVLLNIGLNQLLSVTRDHSVTFERLQDVFQDRLVVLKILGDKEGFPFDAVQYVFQPIRLVFLDCVKCACCWDNWEAQGKCGALVFRRRNRDLTTEHLCDSLTQPKA
jgi:hypothetical protein